MQLYIDLLSQPARACALFCRLHELPVEEVRIHLNAQEQLSEEYVKINPLHKVPFLQDGDYGLPESCSILKYLKHKFTEKIADHWYPSDPKEALAVDALTQWYHMTLRNGCSNLLVEYVIVAPKLQRVRTDVVVKARKTLKDALNVLETQFLSNTTFCSVPTTNTSVGTLPSLADLIVASELESLSILKYFPNVDADIRGLSDFVEYPNVTKFLSEMRKFCDPHYQQVMAEQCGFIETLKASAKL